MIYNEVFIFMFLSSKFNISLYKFLLNFGSLMIFSKFDYNDIIVLVLGLILCFKAMRFNPKALFFFLNLTRF